MATITKRDMAERIARKTGQPQSHVKDALQMFFEEIVNSLVRGDRLEFRNFGVFEVVERKPRTGRNPRTGERVAVPAKKVVNFRMGKEMKERIARVPAPPPAASPPVPESTSPVTDSFAPPREPTF